MQLQVRPDPDDGKRNCPKNVKFYPKNKFEKSVHLIGFIIRTYSAYFLHVCEDKLQLAL